MVEAAELVRTLTPAQKRIVRQLSDREFTDAYSVCRQRDTRMKLTNSGITEPARDGPVTSWWRIRLTPLGVQVRDLLAA